MPKFSNIIKEAEEELGLKSIKPKLGPKTKIDNYFVQWYTLNIYKDISEFKIQENEVEEIKWFSIKEMKKYFYEHPEEFTPAIKIILRKSFGSRTSEI